VAFYDDLARDPKSEEEFWQIIEETFEQIEGALTDYPVETREEALEQQRSVPLESIRYRGASEHYYSRDYFLGLGRQILPEVERQITARKLTPKFAKDWGVFMMCHGFISARIRDDSDGLSHIRAGKKTRSKEAQRKCVARQILALMKSGLVRVERMLG
jgi:hypothetical protein